jgi:hypothetical protein
MSTTGGEYTEIFQRGEHNDLRKIRKWLLHEILPCELGIVTIKCEIEVRQEKVTLIYINANMITV